MSYRSVREILNAVFDSDDNSLKTIFKTDGEVLNMVLDETEGPALKVNMAGGSGLTDAEKAEIAKASYNAVINPDRNIDQRLNGVVTSFNEFICDRFKLGGNTGTGTSTASGENVTLNNKQWNKLSGAVTGGNGAEYISDKTTLELDLDLINSTNLVTDVYSPTGGDVAYQVYYNYGAGGSTPETISESVISIPSGESTISVPITPPVGKTIGSGAVCIINLFKQAGTNYPNVVCNHTADLYFTATKLGYNDIRIPVDPATELVKCQRYLPYRNDTDDATSTFPRLCNGLAANTVTCDVILNLKTSPRIKPTTITYSGAFALYNPNSGLLPVTGMVVGGLTSNKESLCVRGNVASGLTQGAMYQLMPNNDSDAYIEVSTEL